MICIKCSTKFSANGKNKIVCPDCHNEYLQSLPEEEISWSPSLPVKPIWPDNLYVDIIGKDRVESIPVDLTESVNIVLAEMLREDESQIIRYRYQQELTYREIGEILKLSKDAVSQKINKVIRRLRHPARLRYLRRGVAIQRDLDRIEQQVSEITAKRALEQAREDAINSAARTLGVPRNSIMIPVVTLQEMNLSTRSYNGLAIAKFNTNIDFIGKGRADLQKLRYIGKTSIEEIETVLRNTGIDTSNPREYRSMIIFYDENQIKGAKSYTLMEPVMLYGKILPVGYTIEDFDISESISDSVHGLARIVTLEKLLFDLSEYTETHPNYPGTTEWYTYKQLAVYNAMMSGNIVRMLIE